MKDRSFAHRLHQSNIDRQRNLAVFHSRGPRFTEQVPTPKADFWQRVGTSLRALVDNPWFNALSFAVLAVNAVYFLLEALQ